MAEGLTCWHAGLSNWELAAVESLSGTCKSVLLGIAAFKVRHFQHLWPSVKAVKAHNPSFALMAVPRCTELLGKQKFGIQSSHEC